MPIKKILLILLFVICAFLSGTFGYMSIEGWNFADSFFMTLITLTTIGFGEVHPLSETGRTFTIFLILIGLGLVSFSISTIMNTLLNFDLKKHKRGKMNKKVEELKDHTIVCAFGRMGSIVCEELSHNGTDFVVIEKEHDRLADLEKSGFLYIDGDASNEEILEKAGISRAKVLVSMVDSDADALYISLVSRSVNPDLFIICRASVETAKARILRAGANRVVLPTRMTAIRVAEFVLNPAVEDFLDISGARSKKENRIQLADLFVGKDSDLIGKSLGEKGSQMEDLIVVGVRKSDKSFLFKPPSSYVFKEGDCLISMGSQDAYLKAKDNLKLDTVTPF